MTGTLIRKQLLEIFNSYFVDRKTGKLRGGKSIAMYVVLAVLLFGGTGAAFYNMAVTIGGAVLGNGFNWLYFALMALLSMALGVFGSVFSTYESLYLPKDNEFLMSLPIPDMALIIARVSGVYVTSLMYSAWFWIPAVIAYWVTVPAGAAGIVFPVLMTFVIALFVSVLSCVLGWVVALVVSRTRGRSFLTVFLSLFVMAAYYFVYLRIVNSLRDITQYLDTVGAALRSRMHYIYLIGRASDGSAAAMLLVLLITAALAAVCLAALKKSFRRLTLSSVGQDNYRRSAVGFAASDQRKALVNREFRHFMSAPTWMLNGGIGLLLMPVTAVVLAVKCYPLREVLDELAKDVPEFTGTVALFLLAFICMMISTNCILPVSVSLEGKSLWILQTLPVDPWDVLRAKEKMDIMLNIIPVLFMTVVTGWVLRIKAAELVLVALASCVYIWLTADFGLFLNLRRPDLTWTSMAAVVKRSPAVVISLFGGWLFCGLFAYVDFKLSRVTGPGAVLVAMTVLYAVLLVLLRRWLRTRGTEIFADL